MEQFRHSHHPYVFVNARHSTYDMLSVQCSRKHPTCGRSATETQRRIAKSRAAYGHISSESTFLPALIFRLLCPSIDAAPTISDEFSSFCAFFSGLRRRTERTQPIERYDWRGVGEIAYRSLLEIAAGDRAVYCFSYLSSVSVITFSCFWSCLKVPEIESIGPAASRSRSKRALSAALIVFILTSPSK